MSDFTDLQDQVNELEMIVSDNTDNFSDYQSQTDDSLQTIQDQQATDEENIGQLSFPLSQDTIDLIMELFPTGTVTLASGTATLVDNRISTTSTILFNITTPSVPTVTLSGLAPYTFTPLYYYVTITAGQAVFHSSNGSDASILNYLLIP